MGSLWLCLSLQFVYVCWAVTTKSTVVRPLGGYERLLSRLTPGTNQLSLSHGSVFIMDDFVPNDILSSSVALAMIRHPLLRCCIIEDKDGKAYWKYSDKDMSVLADDVIQTVEVSGKEDFQNIWGAELQRALNKVEFDNDGPLWRLLNIINKDSSESAWVFCMNHGMDDQKSVNIIVQNLIDNCNYLRAGIQKKGREELYTRPLPFPSSMEDAMVDGAKAPKVNTINWAAFQLWNLLQNAACVPYNVINSVRRKDPDSKVFTDPDTRETICEPFKIQEDTMSSLRGLCREEGVTVTHILSAVMLAVTAAVIQEPLGPGLDFTDTKLRFLLSVDLRPFAVNSEAFRPPATAEDWTGGTVACAAGAVDYIIDVPPALAVIGSKPISEEDVLSTMPKTSFLSKVCKEKLWYLARESQEQAEQLTKQKNYVPESVRLFGLGMQYAEILQTVEADAKNEETLGRGFSCGVSNMGLAKFYTEANTNTQKVLSVKEAYYGTSHSRNGVLCQLSCMSIANDISEDEDGKPIAEVSVTTQKKSDENVFCGNMQFPAPIVSRQQATSIKNRVIDIIEALTT